MITYLLQYLKFFEISNKHGSVLDYSFTNFKCFRRWFEIFVFAVCCTWEKNEQEYYIFLMLEDDTIL